MHPNIGNLRKMRTKEALKYITFLWCIFTIKAEGPLLYLHTPYINQNAFPQTVGTSFRFSSPPYTVSRFAASRIFIPQKTYIQSKIYPLPVTRYSIQTTGFEEEYHHEQPRYEYHYNVQDPHHGTEFGHKEYRDEHVAKGQYIVLLPDGRRQIVDYVADSNGYRPTIRYEEGVGFR